MSQYQNPMIEVLKNLSKGHPVYVEYARAGGQPCVVLSSALYWGMYSDNNLALFVDSRHEETHNEWYPQFNWVQTDRISVLRHDVGIKVDVENRRLLRDPAPPKSVPMIVGSEIMDLAIRYHIERKLFELHLIPDQPLPPGASQLTAAVSAAPQIVPEPVPAPAMEVEAVPVF